MQFWQFVLVRYSSKEFVLIIICLTSWRDLLIICYWIRSFVFELKYSIKRYTVIQLEFANVLVVKLQEARYAIGLGRHWKIYSILDPFVHVLGRHSKATSSLLHELLCVLGHFIAIATQLLIAVLTSLVFCQWTEVFHNETIVGIRALRRLPGWSTFLCNWLAIIILRAYHLLVLWVVHWSFRLEIKHEEFFVKLILDLAVKTNQFVI